MLGWGFPGWGGYGMFGGWGGYGMYGGWPGFGCGWRRRWWY